MKLNNKGYLIIEIVMASMIAFGIAYFLFDLTLNLKNKSDNIQAKTIIMSDRTIIENYIMKELHEADYVNCGSSGGVERNSSNYLQIKKGSNTTYIFFPNDGGSTDFYFAHKKGFQTSSEIIYKKSANKYINAFNNNSLECKNTSDKVTIKINISDKFQNEDYGIDLEYVK